jgi:hypothetical protein
MVHNPVSRSCVNFQTLRMNRIICRISRRCIQLTIPDLIIIGDNHPMILPAGKDLRHMAGLVDSVNFAWDEIGTKAISVTASNIEGQ